MCEHEDPKPFGHKAFLQDERLRQLNELNAEPQATPLYRRTEADRAVLLRAAEFLARTDTLKEGVDGRDERRALAAKLREMAS